MINSFTFGVGYGNNKNMCTNSKLLGVKLPKNVSLLKKYVEIIVVCVKIFAYFYK